MLAYDWELSWKDRNAYGEMAPCPKLQATYAEFRVKLDLFNSKDIPVGLRDVKMVFADKRGETVSRSLYYGFAQRTDSGQARFDAVDVINLPSRQYVHLELKGCLSGNELKRIINADVRVTFRAQSSGGREVSAFVAELSR